MAPGTTRVAAAPPPETDGMAERAARGRARGMHHLRAIAVAPRPAGSAAEAVARAHAAQALRAAGFEVHEVPFAYSALPGRWATPLGGAASIGALAAAG